MRCDRRIAAAARFCFDGFSREFVGNRARGARFRERRIVAGSAAPEDLHAGGLNARRPEGPERWLPRPECWRESRIRGAVAPAARDDGHDMRSGVLRKPAFLFRLFQLFDNRLKRALRDVFLALEIR